MVTTCQRVNKVLVPTKPLTVIMTPTGPRKLQMKKLSVRSQHLCEEEQTMVMSMTSPETAQHIHVTSTKLILRSVGTIASEVYGCGHCHY